MSIVFHYMAMDGSPIQAAWQLENAIVGKFLQQYPEAPIGGNVFFFGGGLWDLAFF